MMINVSQFKGIWGTLNGGKPPLIEAMSPTAAPAIQLWRVVSRRNDVLRWAGAGSQHA